MAEEPLKIVFYPDPRLKKPSVAVSESVAGLEQLIAQMFATMRAEGGVGLAAPQIGRNIRLFIMNATGKPEDDRVYINPVLSEADGDEEVEEGCLSIPELRVKVFRAKTVRIEAKDQKDQPINETQSGFVARIWQHEIDHLNGVLITDRMGPVAKIAHRGLLKDLEAKYNKKLKKK